MRTDLNKLPKLLQTYREKSGLSQVEVAEKLGYTTSQFVSNWERGLSAPPFNALRKLAVLYKIDADELFDISLENKIEQVKADLRRKFYQA
ncbi:MAG: helix-turn-helix domain-containing protein [Bdellovibrio sp.]